MTRRPRRSYRPMRYLARQTLREMIMVATAAQHAAMAAKVAGLTAADVLEDVVQ